MKQVASFISSHILTAVTLAFIAGIALSPQIGFTQYADLIVKICTLILITILIIFQFFRRSELVFLMLVPLFLGIGCYHAQLRLQAPTHPNHLYNKISSKTDVVLVGTMATMATFNGKNSQATIVAKSMRIEGSDHQPVAGKILLRLKGVWPHEILPGDTLAIRAELNRPYSYNTPGTFDYARYLAQKDIWITGFSRSPLFLQKVHGQQSLFHKLRYFGEIVRTKIGSHIDASLTGDQAGVYRAILIGDRTQVSHDTLEAFKGSGVMHILAISGLHMSVIGALLYAFFYWLLSRSEKLLLNFNVRKFAAVSCLPALIFYTQLAGMNTPVVRSVIMSCIVVFALCSDRQKSLAALLSCAALLILIFQPLQLFTVSFQLSFSAIIAILFLIPVLKKLLFNETSEVTNYLSLFIWFRRWALAGFLVSLVATFATFPISLYAFNRISLVGPLANLVIEPLICLWSLTLGFLAIPFVFAYPEVSSFLLVIGAKGIQFALYAANLFSSAPFSSLHLPTPPVWLIFITYALMLALILSFIKNKKRFIIPAILALSFSLVLFVYSPVPFFKKNKDTLQISFLDVGQGSATLIEYPSGYRMLIDGGSISTSATSVGERVIAPFLWQKGIRKINAIAITHPDADHYSGIEFIIKNFKPKKLWVRDKHGHDNRYQALLAFAEKDSNVSVILPDEGNFLLTKDQGSLDCIANIGNWSDDPQLSGSRGKANSGLILKTCSSTFCTLFPGDIVRGYEKALIEEKYDIKSDVLLSPHHGSITSNSEQFLKAVSPKYLIVSAGRFNKGNFPFEGLEELCERYGIRMLTTAKHGTLVITAFSDSYYITGYMKDNNNPLSPFKRINITENL